MEVLPNNFVYDFKGIGVKKFDFTAESLQEIIVEDITSNYGCITHITTKVNTEDMYVGTSTALNTHLTIRVYFKTQGCEDKQQMETIITQYLKSTFI